MGFNFDAKAEAIKRKLAQQQWDDALQLLDELSSQIDTDDQRVHALAVFTASILCNQGEYERAEPLFAAHLEQFDDAEDEHFFQYAYALYLLDKYDDARNIVDQLSESMEDDARLYQLSGRLRYFADDDYEYALDDLLHAETLDEACSDPHIIADCMRMTQRYEDALPYYEAAISQFPDTAHLYYGYAICLRNIHRMDEAISNFDKAIALNEDYAAAYLDKGRLLVAQGKNEEALDLFEKASDLGNEDAKEAIQELANAVFAGTENLASIEYEQHGQGYYALAPGEADTSIHPQMQFTYDNALSNFTKLRVKMGIGFVLAALLIWGQIYFEHHTEDALPQALDFSLVVVHDAELMPRSVYGGEQAKPITIKRNTPIKAVAWRSGQFIAELPDGTRGIVPIGVINANKQLLLPEGTPLFNEATGGRAIDTLRSPQTVTNLTTLEEGQQNQRFLVRLENGKQQYINRWNYRTELRQLPIPRLNYRDSRLYDAETIKDELYQASVQEVLTRLGQPIGVQYDKPRSRTMMVFPAVDLLDENGLVHRGTQVVFEKGSLVELSGHGKTVDVAAYQLPLARTFLNSGLANIFRQAHIWDGMNNQDWLDELKEWSAWVGWIVQILLILLLLGALWYILMALFGLPVLLLYPLVLLLGGLPFVRNGLLKVLSWVGIVAGFIIIFNGMFILAGLDWGYWGMGFAGFILLLLFFHFEGILNDKIEWGRCSDCRKWHTMRFLGSLYLGRTTEYWYEDVYTGRTETSTTITHHYERQRRHQHKYHYQDFYGCTKCGTRWSHRKVRTVMRFDMDHNAPLSNAA